MSIVGDQDGLITRTQAVAAGMSASAVDRALRNRWQVVLPGVYASFTGPLNLIHRLRRRGTESRHRNCTVGNG